MSPQLSSYKKNGCLNAAFSFNFLPFLEEELGTLLLSSATVVIYFVGFKKCTTQPDNHFTAADRERRNTRGLDVSRRTLLLDLSYILRGCRNYYNNSPQKRIRFCFFRSVLQVRTCFASSVDADTFLYYYYYVFPLVTLVQRGLADLAGVCAPRSPLGGFT